MTTTRTAKTVRNYSLRFIQHFTHPMWRFIFIFSNSHAKLSTIHPFQVSNVFTGSETIPGSPCLDAKALGRRVAIIVTIQMITSFCNRSEVGTKAGNCFLDETLSKLFCKRDIIYLI